MVTTQRSTAQKKGLAWRIGRRLRAAIRREQASDPQWSDEERRERTGQMGENIEGQGSPRPKT
ncbi:MAG TPA: hypothetical protein VF881_13350 [Polyangiaceae bacterium]